MDPLAAWQEGEGRAVQTRGEIDRLGQGTLGVSSAAAICLLGFHFFQYLYVWDSETISAMSSLCNPSKRLPLSGPGFHQTRSDDL